ncbi:hypothetical protein [Streptomyces sp. NPDC046862]|uniref:hypothetical protein n=1 Tax=Streptomyces sp. NPDC046862 TaxID=3154603 RepID=UPI00345519B5
MTPIFPFPPGAVYSPSSVTFLRGGSYELDDGRRVLVDGLLLEMWRVFETFLATALGEELQRRAGGRAEPCDRDHHLDLGKKELLKPDLIHYLPLSDGGR